ncbi:hypothetical protein L7F22_039943 [Adiantum nelumboides]|nr:hypothetical protein [Adiantum nelumboides]
MLMYGFQRRSPVTVGLATEKIQHVKVFLQDHMDMLKLTCQNVCQAQDRYKKYANEKRRQVVFKEGDYVFLRVPEHSKSLKTDPLLSYRQDFVDHLRYSSGHTEFGIMEWYSGAEPRNSAAVATAAACFLPLYQNLDTYQHHAHHASCRTPMNCTAACDPAPAPMIPTFQRQAVPVPILHTEAARPHRSRKRKMPLSDKCATLHTLPKSTNLNPLNLVDLNHAQARSSSPAPAGHNMVSTGLCLASFDDDGSSVTTSSRLDIGPACIIGDELAALLVSQQNELRQLFKAHADRLQNTLKERNHLHSQAFLSRVEDEMSRRLRDEDAELGRVRRHNSELEERIKRLSLQMHVWQSKARSYESMVSVLRVNLQQAMLHQSREQVKLEGCGDSDADDAASKHIDETSDDQHTRAMTMRERKAEVLRACKRCRVKEVTVLLLPCMHLCVCHDCKLDVERCPICTRPKSAFIEVYLS